MKFSEDGLDKFVKRKDSGFKGILLNVILGILSYIIPKNKKLILIGLKYGEKFYGNPKYFYLYLKKKKNEECRAVWVTSSDKIFSELSKKNLPVVNLYSLAGFFSILRAHFLVFDPSVYGVSYSFFLPGKFNKVQTWHGVAFKKESTPTHVSSSILRKIVSYLILKEKKSYNTIITCSEKSKKRDSSMFHNKNVVILGYPRNDIFFDKSLVYENYEKKLDLEKYDKVILYCPTYRDVSNSKIPFSKEFLQRFNNFLIRKNFILLEKRHIYEKNTQDYSNYSNIKNVSEQIHDIQELLICSDIMITDYSSVCLDFCLTNKPIIFYPFDFEEYLNKCRGLVFDYFNDLPGPFVKTEDELLECIQNIDKIYSDKGFQEKLKQFKEWNHFFNDGNSNERLFNYLLKKS